MENEAISFCVKPNVSFSQGCEVLVFCGTPTPTPGLENIRLQTPTPTVALKNWTLTPTLGIIV